MNLCSWIHYVGRQTEFFSNCVKLSGLSGLSHWFLCLCFRSEKIQNPKIWKKTWEKKPFKLFSEKLMRATKLKKHWTNFGTGNESDKINKNWPILNKVIKGDEKTSKKNTAGKKFFISLNELVFFRNVFVIWVKPKIGVILHKISVPRT